MDIPSIILVSIFALSLPFCSSSITTARLTQDSSLSIQDVLVSAPNSTFTAGFFSVGVNAYCFSIWFSEPFDNGNYTIVWMANRDHPVNGKLSRFSLLKSGNLVLTDAGEFTAWTSNTRSNSSSSLQLQLHDNGNLVLSDSEGETLWQSFDSPTDTLLPGQLLTPYAPLISKRSLTNYSSGFYQLYFDTDNVLRQMYQSPDLADIYWPAPWLNSQAAGRSTNNNSKNAWLDSSGHFQSSDEFQFKTVDFGPGIQRRLTIDFDGTFRVYSLDHSSRSWKVSWQAQLLPCNNHGLCGANSLCTYDHVTGRKCTCAPGYRMVNPADWTYGCEPDFQLPCDDPSASGFLELSHVEYYGYDVGDFQNYTLEQCKELCLRYCDCKGFQYKFNQDGDQGYYNCFPKFSLHNGYSSIGFPDPLYIRLPISYLSLFNRNPPQENLECSLQITTLDTPYGNKHHHHGWVKSFLWCTVAVGALEIVCLLAYLFKTRVLSTASTQDYRQVATGFRRFSYAELKKASRNFSEEIGEGGGSVVYKGVLSDNRVAAIKCLHEANQGEAVFLTEVTTIGRLNHMNLIELWGYCAEGKHRMLVYEYMEHGSLAKNLYFYILDWKNRYEIALGTAKGLAYLHEECLEWVLHCDVKSENILLDSNYQPKVADFGLSKLLNRGGMANSSFSRIRGTRGYMAPEWVFNLPITSKVDVYSYGIVVLEMITGKSPVADYANENNSVMEPKRLVKWVKESMQEAAEDGERSAIMAILDPRMSVEFEVERMVTLVRVALQCVEEDKNGRPTMRQVVDMLMHQEKEG